MKTKYSSRISVTILIVFIIISTFLPLFSFEGYSLLSNTTSHLGAQGSPHAWIMNLTFVLLGLHSLQIAYSARIPYIKLFGGIFGLSLILTGVFHHGPLIDGILINHFQDLMHSIFATTTGISFTFLSLGHGIMSKGNQRIVGVIIALIAINISIMMRVFPYHMGILQRIMLLASFLWLFLYFKPAFNYKKSKARKNNKLGQ